MSSTGQPSPRALAAAVLLTVARTEGFSNRILGEHLERAPEMDGRDRGLATTLVYGVLRHRTRIDTLIDHCADRPGRLGPRVREVLRIAAFELRELERPVHVAISQAMATAEEIPGGSGLRGVIQAILSRIAREGDELDRTMASRTPLDALEQRWSIPRWWAGRWLKALGPDRALARARALSLVPSVELRVDLGRTTMDVVLQAIADESPRARIERVRDTPGALRVHGGADLFYGPLHGQGLISVQSVAAQQPGRLLDPQPGEIVMDACAGIGVKTLQLAELMKRRGRLLASDADARRLERLAEVRDRGSLDGRNLQLETRVLDLSRPLPDDVGSFDAILLDAPCTGLGNVARHPETRWHRTFQDIGARSELQQSMLRNTLARLAPGGRLVYAVCSLEPEEGPEVVTHATGGPSGFRVVAQRTWTPEADGIEGFYMARIERDHHALTAALKSPP